ncbi:hypothetical protein OS176_13530 [Xanthomonadaceae bacterium XH05]|nr:hypothetical protein [Xanthomonadaceae bacterium XH05]
MQLDLNNRLQSEIRREHYDGAPGVLTSALVWLIASAVCFFAGALQGVWALLIGGALIYPISALLARFWVKPKAAPTPNPLNQLAGASTVWLIACCVMAYGLYHLRSEMFFPAVMLAIGCRYTVFATVYGLKIYWVLGIALVAASFLSFFFWLAPPASALVGGLVELAFAIVIFRGAKAFAAAA